MKAPFQKKDNDLYVVNFPQKTKDIFFDIYLRTGYSEESNNEFGIGHLLEHYLVESLTDNMKFVNGSTGQDFTNYYLQSDSKRIVKDVKIFLNTILNSNFSDEKLFKREKEVIENEIRNKKNIKEESLNFILKKFFGSNFPYAREKVNKIFCSGNIFFVLSGFNIDGKMENNILNIIKEHKLAKIKKNKRIEYSFSGEKFVKNSKYYWNDELIVNVSFDFSKKIRKNTKNIKAINMLRKYFEDLDFYCAKNMRDLGIYSSSFEWMIWDNAGIVILSSMLNGGKANIILGEFLKFLEKVKKDGISNGDLVKLRRKEKEGLTKAFGNNARRLSWVVNDLLSYGDVTLLKDDIKELKSIDSNYIKKIAKKLFDFDKMNITILGKDAGKTKIKLD